MDSSVKLRKLDIAAQREQALASLLKQAMDSVTEVSKALLSNPGFTVVATAALVQYVDRSKLVDHGVANLLTQETLLGGILSAIKPIVVGLK